MTQDLARRVQLAAFGVVSRQGRTGVKALVERVHDPEETRLPEVARAVLLVFGAPSRLRTVERGTTPLDAWTRRLLEHKPKRLVTVALANKTARIVWAVMAGTNSYQPERAAA